MPPRVSLTGFMMPQEEEHKRIVYPLLEAQLDTLQHVLNDIKLSRQNRQDAPFEEGERVRYINNCGDILSELRDTMAMLFWRYIYPDCHKVDASLLRWCGENIHALGTADCLVMHLTDTNDVVFSVSNTDLLERV